jgi:hypothetical protein
MMEGPSGPPSSRSGGGERFWEDSATDDGEHPLPIVLSVTEDA